MSKTSLARARSLTPLAERLGPFGGFDGSRGRQERIYAALAPLARRDRRRHPVRFYSMPEVAAHFGVALGTVAAVYRRLEQEGLVARIRGAGTILAARSGSLRPRVPVRGVVAVINWLPGFMHVADQRFFLMQLERHLWERGFSVALVFYHEEEKRDPAFAARILGHRPDVAVWLTPGPDDIATIKALDDAGVRTVAVADRPLETHASKYVIGWQRGLETALRSWRKQGIERVVIPCYLQRFPRMAQQLDAILSELGIAFSLYPMTGSSMEDYVAGLMTEEAGVAFDFDMWHAQVCMQAPHAFARLLAQRRVLNCWSLPIAADVLGTVRTDAVILPWRRIVDRLVADLHTGAISRLAADVPFEAEWKPQILAARLSRLHAFERI